MTDKLSNRFYSADGWDESDMGRVSDIIDEIKATEAKMLALVDELSETNAQSVEAQKSVTDALHDYLWGDAIYEAVDDLKEAEKMAWGY
jgi:hypothetical protein